MRVGSIKGFRVIAGESQGFIGLPIRYGQEELEMPEEGALGGMGLKRRFMAPALQSIWLPEPQELHLLMNGAPILLTVLANQHPPVRLEVDMNEKP